MNWSDLRGHQDRIDMLRRSIARGRMAHAWLFAGPPGVGKFRFARILAQALMCERFDETELDVCDECPSCRKMNAGTHPDFFVISCPDGKAEIPVELFYGAKERRGQEGLIHDLSLRPMAGDRRIAIIDDANRMNEEGANAMLKTLEEPPQNSLLILIAENLDAVLPTIRSRCQLVRFSPLAENEVADLLLENETTSDRDEALAAAAMSDGSLQTATQLLNPELRTLRDQLYSALSSRDLDPLKTAKLMSDGLDSLGSELSEQRRNCNWLIRFVQEFYRQAGTKLAGDSSAVAAEVDAYCQRVSAAGSAGLELTMDLFDRAVLAESHIDWNINPARTLEALLDELARTARERLATVAAAR